MDSHKWYEVGILLINAMIFTIFWKQLEKKKKMLLIKIWKNKIV